MRSLGVALVVLSALSIARPTGAGEDQPPLIQAKDVARAFEILRNATGTSKEATATKTSLHTEFSDEATLRLLQEHNSSAIRTEEESFRYVVDKDTTVSIRNYSKGGLQVRFIEEKGQFSFDLVNEWNRTKRPMKAYVSEDGSTTLELDILVAGGGVTEELVIRALRFFDSAIATYRAHLAKGVK